MQKFSENLDQDKDRQLSKLQNEIRKRREKRKEKTKKSLEDEEIRAVKADDEEERKELLKVNQQQANQLKTRVERVRPKSPIHRPGRRERSPELSYPSGSPSAAPKPPVAPLPLDIRLGERYLSQLILATPLFGQVSEIEFLLQNQLGDQSLPASASTNQPYIDLRDAQWECKGDLVPVDIQSLRPSDFVVYRFGVFVSQLLSLQNHLPEVSVLLASNLPPNNYARNCFRNSFHYQHAGQLLFIRKERMDSVGEFVLVIMHCLAHINAGELTDDSNPLFLRAFYQVSFKERHILARVSHLIHSIFWSSFPLRLSGHAARTCFLPVQPGPILELHHLHVVTMGEIR